MVNGKRKTMTIKSLQEARKVEDGLRSAAFGAAPAPAPVPASAPAPKEPEVLPTFDEVFKQYIKYAKLKKSSWRDDQSRYDHHIKRYFGRSKMTDIKPYQITQNIVVRLSGTRKPETVVKVLALLRRVFNWSIQMELYDGLNPVNKVEKPKVNNIVMNVPSGGPERLIETIKSWTNTKARLATLYALYTGKRRGEIVNLKWADVDMDACMATYRNTKNGTDSRLPVSGLAMDVIKQAKAKIRHPTLVFGYSTASGLTSSWVRFKRQKKLPMRFHDLRHCFASYLASSGKVDIYTLQQLLGHKNVNTTQRYAHLTNKALKRAVDVVDNVMMVG
jgi:integrase